ncbi:hypothetical protein BV25DRAFT_1843606 [Artomyces pyxidatus]|uniref:Uncharacterized protein n=1 Tax=Artomyces pyxidatus TaxID=48021 RepID=A0ACB8SDV0_9AGAM|nr:hypothetical protein BV25DRAFT_1843606 [Artomyces pyxidatus]
MAEGYTDHAIYARHAGKPHSPPHEPEGYTTRRRGGPSATHRNVGRSSLDVLAAVAELCWSRSRKAAQEGHRRVSKTRSRVREEEGWVGVKWWEMCRVRIAGFVKASWSQIAIPSPRGSVSRQGRLHRRRHVFHKQCLEDRTSSNDSVCPLCDTLLSLSSSMKIYIDHEVNHSDTLYKAAVFRATEPDREANDLEANVEKVLISKQEALNAAGQHNKDTMKLLSAQLNAANNLHNITQKRLDDLHAQLESMKKYNRELQSDVEDNREQVCNHTIYVTDTNFNAMPVAASRISRHQYAKRFDFMYWHVCGIRRRFMRLGAFAAKRREKWNGTCTSTSETPV